MLDLSQRLSLFQDSIGMSNNAFATKCGINPSNYSKMLKGQQTFTTRSLVKIGDAFPSLNTEWLITGEGEMLLDDKEVVFKPDFKESNVVMVPLIHIDSVGGRDSENLLTAGEQYVERMVPFTNARENDRAILQSGTSMVPTIPPGSILHIRKVHNWREYFGYGGDFVLWLTDDRRITKQVLKYTPDPQHYVICHSYNPEVEDEELPKSMIREVWKVVNVLINKGW